MIRLLSIFLVLMCFSFSALSSTKFKTGKVTSVKMFSDIVVIYVDGIDENACSNGQKRVAIKNNDPIFSVVVSSALTAKATESDVEIGYHEQCTNSSNSWDFESFWIR